MITFVIIVSILIGGFIIYKNNKKERQLKAEYKFVVKKFSKKSELVVADAEVSTSAKKEFKSEATKDWPTWTEPIVKAFVGRTIELNIPIKTEFKIVLKNISENDVEIDKHNNLKFKKPLIVNVDSQVVGEIEILNSKSGLIDKTVDVVTSGKKAQEFFSEKSIDAIYSTSEHVINDEKTINKVLKASEEALENVLNVSSNRKINIELAKEDLIFTNVDPKPNEKK